MTPDELPAAQPLWMSLLQEVRKDVKALVAQGSTVDVRLAKLELRADETVNQLNIGNERMDVANGRTTKNEQAIEALKDRFENWQSEKRGAAGVHDHQRRMALRVWDAVKTYVLWGLGVGVATSVAGIARAVWLASN